MKHAVEAQGTDQATDGDSILFVESVEAQHLERRLAKTKQELAKPQEHAAGAERTNEIGAGL